LTQLDGVTGGTDVGSNHSGYDKLTLVALQEARQLTID
jgi:hypothetical protein